MLGVDSVPMGDPGLGLTGLGSSRRDQLCWGQFCTQSSVPVCLWPCCGRHCCIVGAGASRAFLAPQAPSYEFTLGESEREELRKRRTMGRSSRSPGGRQLVRSEGGSPSPCAAPSGLGLGALPTPLLGGPAVGGPRHRGTSPLLMPPLNLHLLQCHPG